MIETIDTVCEKLLEYNVHKERKDSTRFARGTSETFQALDGLVAKGMIFFSWICVWTWSQNQIYISTFSNS